MTSAVTLNIALSDCLAYPKLSASLAAHRRHHPDTGFHFREQSLADLHQGLLGGTFDAGLCQSQSVPKGIDAEQIWSDTLVLAVFGRHPLLCHSTVTLAQAAEYPWIVLDPAVCAGYREQIAPLLKGAGIPQSAISTVKSFELMMTLVAAGYGVCLAPLARVKRYRALGVAERSVTDASLKLTTYLLRRNDAVSVQLKRFTESLHMHS